MYWLFCYLVRTNINCLRYHIYKGVPVKVRWSRTLQPFSTCHRVVIVIEVVCLHYLYWSFRVYYRCTSFQLSFTTQNIWIIRTKIVLNTLTLEDVKLNITKNHYSSILRTLNYQPRVLDFIQPRLCDDRSRVGILYSRKPLPRVLGRKDYNRFY